MISIIMIFQALQAIFIVAGGIWLAMLMPALHWTTLYLGGFLATERIYAVIQNIKTINRARRIALREKLTEKILDA